MKMNGRVLKYWVAVFGLLMSVAGFAAADDETGNNGPEPVSAEQAVQTVYRGGVPHTDRQGLPLDEYDPQRSFFPIGMWGAPLSGEVYGHNYDWQELVDAGFNTVWPWMRPAAQSLQAGADYNMQIVLMGPQSEETLNAIKDHPNLYGNVWMDEPIGHLNSGNMDQMFQDYMAYKELAQGIAPDMLVFINDAPWITAPATEWWIRWNTNGDVSCHDNYPIWPVTRSLDYGSNGSVPNGIPQSISLAVDSNSQQKPIWLIVGAFDQVGSPTSSFPFRYPTPMQLRALVYCGIIHGATAIHYFIWDSYISRDGRVIGMSPNPQIAYSPVPRQENRTRPSPATPVQLAMARVLWDTTSQVNMEIKELTPAILSPTVGAELEYTVEVEGDKITEAPVRTLLKPDPQGGYILLTVNLDNAIITADFDFGRQLASVEALFENREEPMVEHQENSFGQDYEPFETHVYRIMFAEPEAE